MKATFYKGTVLGAVVSMLVLVASTAVAGTGIGGIFNLGQSNTVNATSSLSGASTGAQLQVTNTGTGTGAQGIAASNNSAAATLYGRNSGAGPGVSGRADKKNNGVEGVSAGAGASGVYGANTSANGYGVAGRSTGASGIGVFGNNTGGGWAGWFTTKVRLDGSLDCSACVFTVNGTQALRLEPGSHPTWPDSPNLIGGFSGNSVAATVSGATIGGGGTSAVGANLSHSPSRPLAAATGTQPAATPPALPVGSATPPMAPAPALPGRREQRRRYLGSRRRRQQQRRQRH